MRGSEVYSNLSERVNKSETEFSTLQREIQETQHSLLEATKRKDVLFLQLANHYLPELVDERTLTSIKAANDAVSKIMHDKRIREEFVERQIASIAKNKGVLEQRIKGLSGEIDAGSETLTQRSGSAKAHLEADPRYLELTSQARHSETLISRLTGLKKEADSEAKEKLPSFTRDPVFSYLLARNFGGAGYNANFVTRFLDSAVAGVIRFDDAKESYRRLVSYPDGLGQRIEREKDSLGKKIPEIKRLEKKEYDVAGVTELLTELNGLSERRKSLMGEDARFSNEYDALHQELTDIRASKGSYHAKAIQVVKDVLLGKETEESLLRRARDTPSTEDDKIVEEIIKINEKIPGYETTLRARNKEAEAMKEQVDRMRQLKTTFETNNWHGSRSRFDSGFDINTLLVGYLIGRSSLSDVTSRMDSSQHFESPPSSSYSSSSSYDSGSSGGGFSSGGGGFGGGFGGGCGGGVGGGF